MWMWIWNLEYNDLISQKFVKSTALSPREWNRLFLPNVRVKARPIGGESFKKK